MTDKLSEEEIYKEASRRVKAKKDFYAHLFSYVLVNVMLVCIWAFVAGGGYPWFAWPLGFWGIGIVSHFMNVFVWGKASKQRAIEKEAERIRRESTN